MDFDATIPLFPLNLVGYPGEKINLHVFEPRYKDLVADCRYNEAPFGIPTYIDDDIEYGVEVNIVSVEKVYEDGRMDIKTIGTRAFRIVNFENPGPETRYAVGDVKYLDQIEDSSPELQQQIVSLLKELYTSMKMVKEVQVKDDVTPYDVAHKIGMSLEQEYELLQTTSALERQQMVISHLKETIPLIQDLENTKERIKMNGHFKHFDPLNF